MSLLIVPHKRFATSGMMPGQLHDLAYVSIRQHTSAPARLSIRQHTSACVSILQHASAYFRKRQHTSAYVSIRQHTSASVSICQHLHDLASSPILNALTHTPVTSFEHRSRHSGILRQMIILASGTSRRAERALSSTSKACQQLVKHVSSW